MVGTKYVSSAEEWIGKASNKSRLNRARSSVGKKAGEKVRGSHVVLFNFDVGAERVFDFKSKHLSVKCSKFF